MDLKKLNAVNTEHLTIAYNCLFQGLDIDFNNRPRRWFLHKYHYLLHCLSCRKSGYFNILLDTLCNRQ